VCAFVLALLWGEYHAPFGECHAHDHVHFDERVLERALRKERGERPWSLVGPQRMSGSSFAHKVAAATPRMWHVIDARGKVNLAIVTA
jgi:hypothetical protein